MRGSMARGGSGLHILWSARPIKVAAVALANKIARMAWAHDGPRRAVQGTKIAARSSIDQELQRIGEGMTT